ncbi:MAG: STN domain-containing protein, partial [Acetobacter malorum]|uniref:STN domain-containing protein n=1 Tax=Acetobacter malorum TaxID=178901 RepID=UPI0039EC26C2
MTNAASISFHIAQKPLRDALVDFGVQAKTRLIFPADTIPNVISPPLNGAFSIQEALTQLLSGSGLTYSNRDGSIFIQKASA